MTKTITGILLLLALTGCKGKEAEAVAANATPWRQPGDKIDSILPMPELIARFQKELKPVAAVAGGETSRDALARRFIDAIAQHDSVTMRDLLLTKAEFAYLFFPDHLYAREPYALDPDIFWLQLNEETRKGSARIFSRYAGKAMTFLALKGCMRDTLQIAAGPDTVWTGCQVNFRAGDSTLTRELFGSIVQRDGRMKFLSYHTEF